MSMSISSHPSASTTQPEAPTVGVTSVNLSIVSWCQGCKKNAMTGDSEAYNHEADNVRMEKCPQHRGESELIGSN